MSLYKVNYCKYYTEDEGKQVWKPTALWTNCEFVQPRPLCRAGARCEFMQACGDKHTYAIKKGTSMTKAERMRIPRELCKAIMEASIKHVHANWERLHLSSSGSSGSTGGDGGSAVAVAATSPSVTSASASASAMTVPASLLCSDGE